MKARAAGLNALAKPLCLGVAALLLLLFSGSAWLFAAAVVLACGIALRDLSRLILRADTIRLSFTLAVSILRGYGHAGVFAVFFLATAPSIFIVLCER